MKIRSFIAVLFLLATNLMADNNNGTIVQLETEFGVVELRLYDETPLHRDNFIKLAKEGFYDDLLFHRVIKNFMIQGGDPASKGASASAQLGAGDLGYTVPSEFVYPQYFHKKGALSAARTADEVNPKKESSASQFYIVTGTVYTEKQLKDMEKQRYERLKQSIFNELQTLHRETIKELYRNGDKETLAELRDNLIAETEAEATERKGESLFTAEEVEAYTTIGGTPFLDNQYTVFGEVISGLEVLDKIQEAETNAGDRPLKDIKMKVFVK